MRLIFSLFCSVLLLLPAFTVSAETPDVIISEVQIEGDSTNDEFIELYNRSDSLQDIGGWSIRKKTKNQTNEIGKVPGTSVKTFSKGATLSEKTFLTWANSNGIFRNPFADEQTTQSLSEDYSLGLFNGKGEEVDAIAWGSGHIDPFVTSSIQNPSPNESLQRNPDSLRLSLSSSPTPTNSVGERFEKHIPCASPLAPDTTIRLNELFPNPKDEDDEWIELYNFGNDETLLGGWILRDKTTEFPLGSGAYVSIPSGTYLAIPKHDSKISLNNSGGETVTLIDAEKKIASEVCYGAAKEEQSFNYSSSGWRWSKTVTKGEPNILNNIPTRKKTDIPKTAYRDVYADFSAKGSDEDGDTIKYTWDFGDDHKSYLRETRHKYAETGTYHGTLTIGDGAEDTVKEFAIEVEKFPDRKVRIISLSANPDGSDTGTEWILLKNKDRKKVDLLGWSIATGTKKKSIANHPVRESFILKPGEEKRMMQPMSLFTLPNERGIVELRRPDGKVTQTVQYRKDEGIKEGELYTKKDGGGWEWTTTKPMTDDRQPITGNTTEETSNGQAKNDSQQESGVPDVDAPQTASEANEAEEASGGMSVIEEQRKEKRLAAIIKKESRIDTPVEILAAPPHVLGASITFGQMDFLGGTSPAKTPYEMINEALNALVHENQ